MIRNTSVHRRNAATGFTLVELLVVIGIIAVLISLLLPSLNRARQAAQMVQCSSNLRQVGIGILGFANDHHGHAPGAAHRTVPSSAAIDWASMVSAEYFHTLNQPAGLYAVPNGGSSFSAKGMTPQLFCTSADPQLTSNSASPAYSWRIYAMNCIFAGTSNNSFPAPPLPMPTNSLGYAVTDASQLSFLSGYYSAIDGWTDSLDQYFLGAVIAKFQNASEKYMVWDTDRSNSYSIPTTTTIAMNDTTAYPAYDAYGGVFSFRHSGHKRMNMLFVDGHVDSLTFNKIMGETQYYNATP